MKLLWILALLPALALGHLLGGKTEADVSETSEPVQFAVEEINKLLSEGGQKEQELIEVVYAERQIVQGEKLYLTLRLSLGTVCEVTVWHRGWLKPVDVKKALQIVGKPVCTGLPDTV